MSALLRRTMDYKKTLNLPSTDFPMRGKLPEREPARLEAWEEERLYERMLKQRATAPLFLLHDGPPYANGQIHAGTALNKILKDIILKYRHMAGYRAPYRPGWDCHGLPIELEVEKKLGRKAKAEMGTVEVRRKCRELADRFVDVQRKEFRRLGVFGDWDSPYLTTDRSYEAAEVTEFGRMVATGGLYRSRKPVSWCASCRTALAEAEVEYEERSSISVYVAFDLDAPSGPLAGFTDRGPAVAIWTTTPWTLPANLAVSLHPDLDYSLVESSAGSGQPLVLASAMIEGLAEKLGLGPVLTSFTGRELEGMMARHPWLDRSSLLITGNHVTLEAGTGCVHTAPGHGEDDFAVGRRYGLDVYAPVDDGGRFTDEVPEFAGRAVFETDPDIIALLDSRRRLLATEPIVHSYPHCWRCKKPIVFRATEQWFVSMEHGDLRARSLEGIDTVEWIPSWGRERIRGMIEARPDWCLSRQRSWGVPVLALHCKGCGEAFVSEELATHVSALFAQQGSDVWFAEDGLDSLLPEGLSCPACGADDFERERDILDVWFDSGVSFSSVVEAEYGADTVADLYLEGSDQHRGWFHSALLVSMATRGRPPYKAVLTHGFVLDSEGRKMSKSRGNVISPQDIVKRYGADILRLWVAAEDYRDDVRISEEILARMADSYRRVRNTARNALGNLYDFDPSTDAVAAADMVELDRWILSALADFSQRCRRAYDGYEFHVVYHALNNFCSVELSSLYYDIVKDRLYCSAKASHGRRSAQTAMYEIVRVLAGVIAPILPFTAEEIWKTTGPGEASVFLADFPSAPDEWLDEALTLRWQRLWDIRREVTGCLEDARKAGDIGHSLDARVTLAAKGDDARLLTGLGTDELATVFIVSQVELVEGGTREQLVEVSPAAGSKCSRCWNYCETVGTHADHPEACSRCCAVVAGPQ